jgi:hypothetical protein
MTELRRCSRCKKEKPETEEYFRKRGQRWLARVCRVCSAKRDKVYSLNHRAHRLLYFYQRRSRRRGLSVTITEEWLEKHVLSKPCHYCGVEKGVGADRINNARGYSPGNIVPCCAQCNRIRSDTFSVAEMKIIGRTLRFLQSRNMECADSISALLFL